MVVLCITQVLEDELIRKHMKTVVEVVNSLTFTDFYYGHTVEVFTINFLFIFVLWGQAAGYQPRPQAGG